MTLRHYAGGAAEARALAAWAVASDSDGWRVLDRRQIHDRQHGRCYLCVEVFNYEGHRSREPLCPTDEHVFPRCAGGGRFANILLAHRLCNQEKGDRWPTPCEIIYLAAIYAAAHDAVEARAAKTLERARRADRRRAKIESYR